MNKIIIAMSGGVDSSAAAVILKRNGYSPVGAMLNLLEKNNKNDIKDAKNICEKLDIQFNLLDKTNEFREKVMQPFAKIYENGATPNPCVICNKEIKFKYIAEFADDNNIEKIATGHYVETEFSNGRYLLKRAKYDKKDQSYVLYTLSQEILSRCVFPLGKFSKEEIRQIAEEAGLAVAAKKDSQDICFVPNGKYSDIIKEITKKEYPHGNFVDENGKILGEHKGLINYTTGQRKGLGLALSQPMYVKYKDTEKNEVVLCTNENLFSNSLDATNINFIPFDKLDAPLRCKAKTRYNQKEQDATVFQTDDNKIHIEFDEKQRAITKGQSVVLYDGEYLLGGGIIL